MSPRANAFCAAGNTISCVWSIFAISRSDKPYVGTAPFAYGVSYSTPASSKCLYPRTLDLNRVTICWRNSALPKRYPMEALGSVKLLK